jgi:ATP-dependent HslUV protease ATP-binding subunit HslU
MQESKLGLTPSQIVEQLDKHIIGQMEAKKSVAVALRNRYRRKLVDSSIRDEISPKNILMIGPTGVGKTEIARRLAKLSNSPFIKIEATKFTEVGYVGRDVESIIRDLCEIAVSDAKMRAKKEVLAIAKNKAIDKVIDELVGSSASEETREKFRHKIESGSLNNTEIEIEVSDNSSSSNSFEIPGMPGAALGVLNVSDMIGKAMGMNKTKKRKLRVEEAIEAVASDEAEKLLDEESIVTEAVKSVENDGIVFLDEIDKIASRSESSGGRGEVSREGVQRDLLPIVEGTTVSTKYGFVKTDHILFISSGAFHISKPSDLLPELQGRFPIRVELKPLNKEDFIRILKDTEASLLKQHIALLATEGVEINFSEDSIEEIASIALHLNDEIENIGARRLHTILEKLLEQLSFDADKKKNKKITIDSKYVITHLESIKKNTDLSKFIL